MKGFVYIIGNRDIKLFKIGFTRQDPWKRLTDMQRNSPVMLELIAWHATDAPVEEERRLHAQFACQRVHGEWFRLGIPDLAEFERWKIADIQYLED